MTLEEIYYISQIVAPGTAGILPASVEEPAGCRRSQEGPAGNAGARRTRANALTCSAHENMFCT